MIRVQKALWAVLLTVSVHLSAQESGVEWSSDLQTIIATVSLDSLRTYVRQLSGEVPVRLHGNPVYIKSRNKSQPGNELACQFLLQKLTSFGAEPHQQVFSSTGTNVIFDQRGTTRPNQKFILCAHYDDMPANSSLAPGADDNASGTAAVLEAARIFHSFQFPYTVTFALWDEEEQGLIGSRHYAQLARARGDSILGVINMDMIGFDSNDDFVATIHVLPVANSAQLAQRMTELNRYYDLRLFLKIYEPGLSSSDHNSFWRQDYGAVLLIEDYYSNFNRYYHSVRDSLNKFNDLYYLHCSKLAIATVASFAMGELPATPTLLTPADLATEVPGRSLFTWSGEREALGFDLELSLNREFSPLTAQLFDLAQPRWIAGGLPVDQTIYWRIRSRNHAGKSAWTTPHQITTGSAVTQTIPLRAGWNLISSSILPLDSSLTALFADLEDNLDVCRDQAGRSFSSSSGSFTLDTWHVGRAYQVRVQRADTLQISGHAIDTIPMAIALAAGWNQVAFTGRQSMPVSQALAGVKDHLLLAQNGAGQVYWPAFHIDEIVTVSPGDGLRLYLTAQDTLCYLPLSSQPVLPGVASGSSSHFSAPPPAEENAVLLVQSQHLQAGDEVAVFTDDHRLAGAAAVNNHMAVITLWGTDRFDHTNPAGAGPDQALYVKHWSRGQNEERRLQVMSLVDMLQGQALVPLLAFHPNAVWMATPADPVIPAAMVLAQNYPNPFSRETTIRYELPERASASLEIFNSLGRCVAVLQQGVQEAGIHEVTWRSDRLAGGVYLCRLQSDKHRLVRKMVLLD